MAEEIMKEEEKEITSNFIHDFIDEDLAEGKYQGIQTRFPSRAERLSPYWSRQGCLH